MARRNLRETLKPVSELASARTYEAFVRAASALDEEDGGLAFRDDPSTDVYDARLLAEHVSELERLRERGDAPRLAQLVEEALYRHQGELSDPRLYDASLVGTKRTVERFWDEIERCIDFLASPERTGLDPAVTLARFRRHSHVFGRSALLLSGGASLGFFHLGVVKALLEQGLLPRVLSGASMGANVACGIASRTDAELHRLFADTRAIRTDALSLLPPAEMVRRRSVFDPERLREVLLHNNGDLTFAESFERSGRIVNVSISPTRERQKPRILCHLNAPDVTLVSAAMASSAVPGAFPPVVLAQRGRDGVERPYMGTETWIDGTFKGDVPTQRLGRLLNVNHFIVSQVNPHVAPVRRVVRRRGVLPFLVDATVTSLRARAASDLGLVRRALAPTPLYKPIDLAHALVDQSYGGDIDIHPRIRPLALARTFANITQEELAEHVFEGERATWPLISRLRHQTCVERALDAAIARLQAHVDRGA